MKTNSTREIAVGDLAQHPSNDTREPRAVFKADVSFGLVTIPVRALPTRGARPPRPRLKFSLDCAEFLHIMDAASLDPARIEATYYLEAGRHFDGMSGHRAFELLALALSRRGAVAICSVFARRRARLAAIVPRGRGLLLHMLFEGDLAAEPDDGPPSRLTDMELELADKLAAQLWKPALDLEDFRVSTQCVPIERERRSNVIDMLEALKRQVKEAKR
jgi:non-homologous end joining protein Ku